MPAIVLRRARAAAACALWACVATTPGCSWLDDFQREKALRPTPGRPAGFEPGSAAEAANFRPGDVRYALPVSAASGGVTEQLALWWLPHPDPAAPTLLYLHGTFRNLYQNLSKINALRAAGFSVVAVDYRGWGESSPIVPSEATINADAATAWAEVVRRQPLPGRRVIFGHSLGGAVAVTLASGLHHGSDYAALALESTFSRLADVASENGFWGRVAASLMTLQFDTVARIGRVDAPLLMLHGSADRTVPVTLGRRLRDAAPAGVHWVEVAGGTHSQLHSEVPALYQQVFGDLARSLAGP